MTNNLLKTFVLLSIILLLSFSSVQAQGYIFTEPTDTVTVMEAEHYFSLREDANFNAWEEVTTLSGYTGDGYMVAPPDDSYGDGAIAQLDAPAITYRVNFTSPGTHYLFYRCSYADGGSDSFWFGVDDTVLLRMNPYTEIEENYDMWGWSQSTASGQVEFPIGSAGEHDLVVYVREPNFRLDKLVITKDPMGGPSGFNENGPNETQNAISGIQDDLLAQSLAVYPNPVEDQATISFEVQQAGQVSVSVFNIYGQMVKELFNETAAPGNKEISWFVGDDTNIVSGVYFVKIDMAGATAMQKIVIK